jgi:Tfp pilus assembly protein PilW
MLTRARVPRGISLVELMVAIAVGMALLLLITQIFVNQVAANTILLKETRLNQELRAIMDLSVRDVRRAGYWGTAISGAWYESSPGVFANPLNSITIGDSLNPGDAVSGSSMSYSYDVNGNGAIDDDENFTIRLNGNVVEMVQGIATPVTTPLSDPGSTLITGLSFSIVPATVAVSCVASGTNPTLTIRQITIALTGRLASDPTVVRSLQDTDRIRADYVTGACPSSV